MPSVESSRPCGNVPANVKKYGAEPPNALTAALNGSPDPASGKGHPWMLRAPRLTTRLQAWPACRPEPSVAISPKRPAPAVIGMPEIEPSGLKLSPEGSPPLEIDHVYNSGSFAEYV